MLPWPIIGRPSGDEGDLVSSSSLSLGRNKIKKGTLSLAATNLLCRGEGRGGGHATEDGGRYVAGGWRQDEWWTEAYLGRGGGGQQWTAVDGSGRRRTAADGGGLRRKKAVCRWGGGGVDDGCGQWGK